MRVLRARSNGEALATLAAAGGKHGLAVARPHADAEAMSLFATAVVGLKRTLHGI
jgi:hypothetical protein